MLVMTMVMMVMILKHQVKMKIEITYGNFLWHPQQYMASSFLRLLHIYSFESQLGIRIRLSSR